MTQADLRAEIRRLSGELGPILLDCVTLTGIPVCMGAAAGQGCTCNSCWIVSDEDHAESVRQAWADFEARSGKCCHDCAFRNDSPEEHQRNDIAQGTSFRCHQGMPIAVDASRIALEHVPLDQVVTDFAYRPRRCGRGRSGDAPDYPMCPGYEIWRARQR